jgi:outer membrane protein
MFCRMPLRPLLVCSALIVAAQAGFAQAKVAVVNLQVAVSGTAEVKKADAQMQATFKPRQDEIIQLQKEIDALSQQIQSGKLTPQQESDVTSLGKRKQTDLQRKQDDFNADAQAFRDDVLQKCTTKMAAIVKKLAEEKGYDLVVEGSVSLYFKPTLDITNDAIAAYDKANPVTATPAGK